MGATACAIDGYVCLNLLGRTNPVLKEHLVKLGLLPETFVQKWFAGLCIHHLPYNLLFSFLDHFFAVGNKYLFQFFLAFFAEFNAELMNAKNIAAANEIIRFEKADKIKLQSAVKKAASESFIGIVAKLDLHAERVKAFEEVLSKRLQSANEGMWQQNEDEITFSDEEGNENKDEATDED